MKKLITLCLLLSQITIFAQENNHTVNSCGSEALNKQLIQNSPKLALKIANYEKAVQSRKFTAKTSPTTYQIPVVVHVMHKGESIGEGTNLSDAIIKGKMKAINEQFRKIPGSTGDGAGVDMEIEFILAVVDPEGNQTNGIDRYDMSSQIAYMNNGINFYNSNGISQSSLKALAFWDSNLYYNIWIVSEVDDNNGQSRIQGAAQPATMHGTAEDGFFIVSNSFKDSFGRMETHELGHAFNLYHTFQGDNPSGDGVTVVCPTDNPAQGDFCADTSPHIRVTSGDCSATSNSCYPDNTDLGYLNNYMNYTLDGCRNMFTADQKNRAITALTTLRDSFLSSSSTDNLIPVTAPIAGFLPATPVVLTTNNDLQLSDASIGVPSNYLNYYNWPGMTFSWNVNNGTTTLTSTDQNPVFNFSSEGVYNVLHDVNNGIGASSKLGNQLIYVIAPSVELPSNTLKSTQSGNYSNNYVKLNTIEKTISTNTNTVYADYINTDKTLLISGETYPLSFNTKAGTQYREYFAVYIDWNGNGNFEESEKLGSSYIGAGTSVARTVDVIVPTNAVKNKLLRMRVSGNANGQITNNMINGKSTFFIGDNKDFGIYVIDQQTLSTSDFDVTSLSFYPNPVKDVLNISNKENIEKVEIYNLMGQLLISEKQNATNIQVNLSQLSRGTYFTTVSVNGKKSTIKVLKN